MLLFLISDVITLKMQVQITLANIAVTTSGFRQQLAHKIFPA